MICLCLQTLYDVAKTDFFSKLDSRQDRDTLTLDTLGSSQNSGLPLQNKTLILKKKTINSAGVKSSNGAFELE